MSIIKCMINTQKRGLVKQFLYTHFFFEIHTLHEK